ncbi:class I SAM-dependent methyltransferase [Geobacter argillaceus]|uniref:Methyltransferase family protein n=1 Tax=Geobacter argillaceus TaxID=345631 RepID=A0A562VM78_9BACT|nr:class I SAM-dependent methyltransferase [Geobacter argillaceus]TWJ18874.1 methyltransferase family protein [Geobacter argillaceus]
MHVSPHSIARFLTFLEKVATETYPEQPSPGHDAVIARAMNVLFDNFVLPPAAHILDVGCGQGVALKPFQERGYKPIGVTLNVTDANICQQLGFDVRVMDQSFLDFDDATFDLVWARHVVEHSFMPLYTLTEFRRVLRPGGILYMEVPAPDTLAHESNQNHYSVLGKTMWTALLKRSRLETAATIDYFMKTVDDRADEFWGFYATATPCR